MTRPPVCVYGVHSRSIVFSCRGALPPLCHLQDRCSGFEALIKALLPLALSTTLSHSLRILTQQ